MLATAAPAISAPTVTLNDGYAHPQIGFGTYKVGFIPASASAAAAGTEASGAQEATAAEIVENALRVGYRFLDCAEFYGNEHEVGAAIAVAGVPREELYLASKVWTTKIYEGPAVETTLADLDTTYLDLSTPERGKTTAANLRTSPLLCCWEGVPLILTPRRAASVGPGGDLAPRIAQNNARARRVWNKARARRVWNKARDRRVWNKLRRGNERGHRHEPRRRHPRADLHPGCSKPLGDIVARSNFSRSGEWGNEWVFRAHQLP